MKKTNTPAQSAILIVDDKASNLLALKNLLDTEERAILQATNGKDALKIALNRSIDLIVLDVQMPDMDGFEVAQLLMSNKKTRNIPIIFASAEKREYQSVMKGYEEGAIDYLFKPLDPEITKAKVSVLLKIQMQKKELFEKNQSLEKSALLINNSADIIGIIDRATLKIEEFNVAFCTILGYDPVDVKNTSLPFFLGKEDRVRIEELAASARDRLAFETRIYCKNRTTKWLHWNVVVKDDKWFVNARDITEIKEVERIRNYLATVVKQSSDAIYIHDHEGRIISWNEGAEKIYGYSEDEALRMKIWNIVPDYLQPDMQETLARVIAGEKIHSIETKRITRHGNLVDVLFSASLIGDPGTVHQSIAITERDVTQQKIAGEQIRQLNLDLQKNVVQLEETNRDLESFSYSVSHDLRAPLRGIGGNAIVLEEDYAGLLDGDGRHALSRITYNVNRMNQLIDDLLTFAKIGKKAIHQSSVNMEASAKRVIDEIGSAVTRKADIRVETMPPAKADASLIHQVWMNLIANAVKYSAKKEAPRVDVGCVQKEGQPVYFVRDNGAGFDMLYADKLFGAFQRLHDETQFEGTGIGLAIVKRIITRHGGRIWAEAKPDEGATFYFTVPL